MRAATAWALPARWYADPAIYQAERRSIFSHQWLWIGREAEVDAAGPIPDCRPRRVPDLRPARRGRRAARLPQCLPAPGVEAADGAERALQRHRMPLSRLALPLGRRPPSCAALRRGAGFPEGGAVALPHLRRRLAGTCLRVPEPGGAVARRVARSHRGGGRAVCAGPSRLRTQL